ncbi:hypothetical protein C1634_024900 [Chryseobacterium viscerum]|uniref:Uncharacterized protein n=1 Tax=Chryseobacterium viscerum TaxID=1037377 RepID=A0A316WHW6_9FLAO|nr:hypothetical protein C1634_024900 [Chryseobacterium viscerum]
MMLEMFVSAPSLSHTSWIEYSLLLYFKGILKVKESDSFSFSTLLLLVTGLVCASLLEQLIFIENIRESDIIRLCIFIKIIH